MNITATSIAPAVIKRVGFIALFAMLTLRSFAGETATAVATVTAGFVTAITVTSGGSGYFRVPNVSFEGGGGTGAVAIAILEGDKVALVLVLNAGAGYSQSPTVIIDPPLVETGIALRMVPALTLTGEPDKHFWIESASTLEGPWKRWTNLVTSVAGVLAVDLSPGSEQKFYRAVEGGSPEGFVWIAPGTFWMGSPLGEPDRAPNETQHLVTLTYDYWMSEHETTQAQYEFLMDANPSHFKGADRPVERVNWDEAMEYCGRLTAREAAAGRLPDGYVNRLPTEAEWEYACRAGTTGPFAGDLNAMAWYLANATHPVMTKQPNAWGIYDMHGNVWEWCYEWLASYPQGPVTDPVGATSGTQRVGRGGEWLNASLYLRSAARGWPEPGRKAYDLGFRPVLAPAL